MSATISLRVMAARGAHVLWKFVRIALMIAGLVLIVGLINLVEGNAFAVDAVKSVLPRFDARGSMLVLVPPAAEVQPETNVLTPRMEAARDFVAHRYRVSADALGPIFETVQATSRDLKLDPLLIVAVIGIESRFNPFSESPMGAQGLMQVIPRFHEDKLPEGAGKLPLFDPVTNVQVGALALREAIRRNGDLVGGLQQFGGVSDETDESYAQKVLAEKDRIEQAVRRAAPRAASAGSPSERAGA